MKINLKSAGITLLAGCGICCGAIEGVIDASWLNARVFPELKAPVAVKLPRGKKVDVTRRWHNWLEITAPDITKVFVSAARLDGDKAVSDVNLRIRPAVSGAVIGRLKAGDKVKPVSVPDKFGWVQIAPSADLRLYVCRDYVKCDLAKVPEEELKKPEAKAAVIPAKEAVKPAATPVKKETEKPAVAPVKKEIKPAAAPVRKEVVKPAAAPVKPAALNTVRKQELEKLNADILNPVPFSKKGSVNAVPASLSPCTNFALLDAGGNNQAFLFSDLPAVDLKKLDGKEVNVTGFSYKVNGWKAPVVQITAISAK